LRSASPRCHAARRWKSTRWWRFLTDAPSIEQAVGSVSIEDIRRAVTPGAGIVRETPVLSSGTLSERAGATVVFKAENLQRTGSFKLRGALAKIASLGDSCAAGVVTASAGNHAQAVAYAARALGVPCEVFMPQSASIAKLDAATALGATVHLAGTIVEEALELARTRAAESSRAFVHPFDDPEVIAGQGGIGLELLAQVPDIARVIVPVGGGGLISGVAVALRSAKPEVEVVGVRVDPGRSPLTIADGIAVKRPGGLTRGLIERWVHDVVVVDEDDVAEAMVFMLERAKLVVEGAGAVGVAALLSGRIRVSGAGTTVVVLSGGNVDAGLLADVARHHESQAGRRLVLLARVSDRPGSLAQLLSVVADAGANLLDVQHIREGIDLHVRESAVQLVLETRGHSHAVEVTETIRAAGYPEPRVLR
jgi:threonine dehydratase